MWTNAYIIVPLVVWLITQLTKFCLTAWQGRVDLRQLYASGGMPSAHASVTSALATTAYALDGGSSHVFGLTVVLAAIVMYDALGVRRASGEQAVALNALINALTSDRARTVALPKAVREVLGHQPGEVAVGAAMGIVLALVFNYQHVTGLTDWLTALPGRPELLVYAMVGAILIVGSPLARWLLRRRRSAALAALARQVVVAAQTLGWILLVVTASAYEKVGYLSWRFWPLLVLVTAVIWKGLIFKATWRSLPAALAVERETQRKAKWLEPKRKAKGRRAKGK